MAPRNGEFGDAIFSRDVSLRFIRAFYRTCNSTMFTNGLRTRGDEEREARRREEWAALTVQRLWRTRVCGWQDPEGGATVVDALDIDPITQEPLTQIPGALRFLLHGRLYDASGLLSWLSRNRTDPTTREPVHTFTLDRLTAVVERAHAAAPRGADIETGKALWDRLEAEGRIEMDAHWLAGHTRATSSGSPMNTMLLSLGSAFSCFREMLQDVADS